nr:hypothetical protein [Phocid alphaherpesvirus 1]
MRVLYRSDWGRRGGFPGHRIGRTGEGEEGSRGIGSVGLGKARRVPGASDRSDWEAERASDRSGEGGRSDWGRRGGFPGHRIGRTGEGEEGSRGIGSVGLGKARRVPGASDRSDWGRRGGFPGHRIGRTGEGEEGSRFL